jgi:hypothetical protein
MVLRRVLAVGSASRAALIQRGKGGRVRYLSRDYGLELWNSGHSWFWGREERRDAGAAELG